MNDDDRRGLEAAFHLAGHAVAAHLSRYHVLALPLRVDAWGSGEVTAALSRRKLIAAERLAAVRPDPARSRGDLEMARAELRGAGLPDHTEPHEAAAATLLALHWPRVETIAKRLAAAGKLSAAEIAALLDSL